MLASAESKGTPSGHVVRDLHDEMCKNLIVEAA
jgi:hypothetical protein